MFGLIVATLDTLVVSWVGIPLAFTWGVLAFVTNYIPNVGFIIGVIPPALVALVDQGPAAALTIVLGYSAINFIVQVIIQPRVTGDVVGVAPSVTFTSLLFWSILLGPLGALLAIPATLLVKALFVDHSPCGPLDAGVPDLTSRGVDGRGTGGVEHRPGRHAGTDRGQGCGRGRGQARWSR